MLDVAAGSGNVAIPAAATGAHVVASDLTPELLDQGKADAEAAGVSLDWQVGDAEHLPFDDDVFDAVTSCVGVMFAPHHQQAADELVRVCRPGGTHRADRLDADRLHRSAVRHHEAVRRSPAAGRAAPAAVGRHRARARAAGRPGHRRPGQPAAAQRRRPLADPVAFREYFKTNYGPTIAAYRGLADDPERTAELDQALVDLVERFRTPDGKVEWEYLLVIATKV